MAQRMADYAARTGAINDTQGGFRAEKSFEDALICLFTPSQDWPNMPTATTFHPPPLPTIQANDIDGAFNTVKHNHLTEVLSAIGYPKAAVASTKNFCSDCTLSFHFDRRIENNHPFDYGLPQGSLLSLVLFVIFSAPAITKTRAPMERNSLYADNNTMLQGGKRYGYITRRL